MKYQETFSFEEISLNDVDGACDYGSGGCGDAPPAWRPAAEIAVHSAWVGLRRSSRLSAVAGVAGASFGTAFAASSERVDAGDAEMTAEWGCEEIVCLKQCR